MKITDTISVNPSKTTLGQVEASSSNLFRASVIGTRTETNQLNLMSFFFPTTAAGVSEFKKYAVPLRTLFSTILIVTGISLLEISMSPALAICSICFGVFLAIGFLTRPIMLGASVFYCIFGALALRSGLADISVFALMFGCILFAIMGSGKYSCDALIRNYSKRLIRKAENKRKENFMGYKAFHNVKY